MSCRLLRIIQQKGCSDTDLLDCGPAPAAPCVGGGGCDQPCPLQPPPCPELKMPSRRAGGQWAGMERSEECPAATRATPGDCHRLGVQIPPTKSERERDWDTRTEKERGREADGGRQRKVEWDRKKQRERDGHVSFIYFIWTRGLAWNITAQWLLILMNSAGKPTAQRTLSFHFHVNHYHQLGTFLSACLAN